MRNRIHNSTWRRGNFVVLVLIIGLLVLGGLGSLHFYTSSSQLTSAIQKQSDTLTAANSARIHALEEDTSAYLASALYDHLKTNESGSFEAKLKEVLNSYSFTNFLSAHGITSTANTDVKVSAITDKDIGNDTVLRFEPIKEAVIGKGGFKVSGLSAQGSTVTTGVERKESAQVNYMLIPNEDIAWYHADANSTSLPKLDNVTCSDSSILYFGSTPQNTTLLETLPTSATILVRGDSNTQLANVYDYTAMNNTRGSLFDYIMSPADNGTTSRNYTTNGLFWRTPALPNGFQKTKYVLDFTSFRVFKEVSPLQEQTYEVCLSGYGSTVSVVSLPARSENSSLIVELDKVGFPLLRGDNTSVNGETFYNWYLNVNNATNVDAKTESVCVLISVLADALESKVSTVAKRAKVGDILHPAFATELTGKQITDLADSIKNGGGSLRAASGWRNGANGYFNFYYANFALKSAGAEGVKMYTAAETRPILGRKINFDNGVSAHFARFPWLKDDILYLLINGGSLGSRSKSVMVLTSSANTTGHLFLGGDPSTPLWYKCEFSDDIGIITNCGVTVSNAFNAEKKRCLVASPNRLTLAFPQKALDLLGEQSDVNISSNPESMKIGLSGNKYASDWIVDTNPASYNSFVGNIKKNTVANSDNSTFYIPNSQVRNQVTCTAEDLGHAEVSIKTVICFYDASATSPTALASIPVKRGSENLLLSNLNPVYVPFATIPTSDDILDGSQVVVANGYLKDSTALKTRYTSLFAEQVRLNCSIAPNDKIARVYEFSAVYSPLKEDNSELVEMFGAGKGLGTSKNLRFYVGWCSNGAIGSSGSISRIELGSLADKN